jgi:hypothetical protein
MRRRALLSLLFMPVYCAWPQVATGRTVRQLAADLRQNPNDQELITKLGKEAGEEASVALAESFELASAKDAKQAIASALVKRGSADSKYWEYLAAFARRAVESKVPFPIAYDEHGRTQRDGLSQEFLDWCKANQFHTNLQRGEVANEMLTVQPQEFAFFAGTLDARNKPLLLKGLLASNYIIVAYSAIALGRMGDRTAAPQIEAACKRVPADMARSIAPALFWFDDPALDSVAKQYIPDAALYEMRRTEALEGKRKADLQRKKK